MLMSKDDQGITRYEKDGIVQSVKPATYQFGRVPWSQMIPPFKPEKLLILGYCEGTIADLVRLVWGDVSITGVDRDAHEGVIQADAETFEITEDYDCVIIDIFDGNTVPDFIFSDTFAAKVKRANPKMVIINALNTPENFRQHFDLTEVRKIHGHLNLIYFFSNDSSS